MRLQLAAANPETTDDSLDARVDALKQRERRLRIWEPPAGAQRGPQPVVIPIERAMIEVIVRPVTEGHRAGNDRKERELVVLFDSLTAIEALTLQRRLVNQRAGDPLVAAFQRLVVERRARLLAYLGDTRRRRALR